MSSSGVQKVTIHGARQQAPECPAGTTRGGLCRWTTGRTLGIRCIGWRPETLKREGECRLQNRSTLMLPRNNRDNPASRRHPEGFSPLDTEVWTRRARRESHLPQTGDSSYSVGSDHTSAWRQSHRAAVGSSYGSGGWRRWKSRSWWMKCKRENCRLNYLKRCAA